MRVLVCLYHGSERSRSSILGRRVFCTDRGVKLGITSSPETRAAMWITMSDSTLVVL